MNIASHFHKYLQNPNLAQMNEIKQDEQLKWKQDFATMTGGNVRCWNEFDNLKENVLSDGDSFSLKSVP